MRRPMMAGNWKMNKTPAEAVTLATAIRQQIGMHDAVDCVVCPTFLALSDVAKVLDGTTVRLGAQTAHQETAGAFTGEVSAAMLATLVEYVIIGHSERRAYFHEDDSLVNQKLKAVLANNMTPILCVGESLEQNEAGETESWVRKQVRAALDGLTGDEAQATVIAYEPIWAIGTGRAATAEQANATCGIVRSTVADLYGDEVAGATRILYGGSTKPANIEEIMRQDQIDGALIGGASLSADSYTEMVAITQRVYS